MVDDAAVFKAMTGRKLPAEITDPREAIGYLYGTNRRGNPNAAAAAAELGVSPDTVRRWIRADTSKRQQPKGDNAARLARTIRAASQQQQQRARIDNMPPTRAKRLARDGMRISITGKVRISKDSRTRSIPDLDLTGPEAAALLTTWASGDDQAFQTMVEELMNLKYFLGSLDASLNLDTFTTKRR